LQVLLPSETFSDIAFPQAAFQPDFAKEPSASGRDGASELRFVVASHFRSLAPHMVGGHVLSACHGGGSSFPEPGFFGQADVPA
jgi:hypothetical protein